MSDILVFLSLVISTILNFCQDHYIIICVLILIGLTFLSDRRLHERKETNQETDYFLLRRQTAPRRQTARRLVYLRTISTERAASRPTCHAVGNYEIPTVVFNSEVQRVQTPRFETRYRRLQDQACDSVNDQTSKQQVPNLSGSSPNNITDPLNADDAVSSGTPENSLPHQFGSRKSRKVKNNIAETSNCTTDDTFTGKENKDFGDSDASLRSGNAPNVGLFTNNGVTSAVPCGSWAASLFSDQNPSLGCVNLPNDNGSNNTNKVNNIAEDKVLANYIGHLRKIPKEDENGRCEKSEGNDHISDRLPGSGGAACTDMSTNSPFHNVDSQQIEDEMACSITELLCQGKNACELEQWGLANDLGRQAKVRASQELKRYITGDTVDKQSLASWFGDCAFILHKIGQIEDAIRCFYTATVFDRKWTEFEHHRVAAVLWENLLKNKPGVLILALKNTPSLWTDIEKITKLAEAEHRWEVCNSIINDIKMHVLLFGPMFGILKLPDVPIMHTLIRRAARCAFHMNNTDSLKKICTAIQGEFSDCDDVEAYELEAMAYQRTGNFELALRDINLGLLCCKDETTSTRLRGLRLSIQTELQANGSPESHEPNPNWLQGTSASATDLGALPKTVPAKTKKKHRRPKARSPAPDITQQEAARSNQNDDSSNTAHKRGPSTDDGSPEEAVGGIDEICYERAKEVQSFPPQNKRTRRQNRRRDVLLRARDRSRTSSGSSFIGHNQQTSSEISSLASLSESDMSSDASNETNRLDEFEPDDIVIDINNEDDSTYYEKSTRLYLSEDCEEAIEIESKTEKWLQSGLQLNMSYVARFEDRRPELLMRNAFYKEVPPTEKLKEMLIKEPNRFKRCTIQIESSHLAYCYPIDSSDKVSIIEISGRSKAGQTFDDDEVVVEILDTSQEPKDKKHGAVIGILERKRHPDINHPVFICTLDEREANLVRPMCKTIPKIHILDRHIMERFPRQKQFKLEIYEYDEFSETLEFNKIIDITPANRDKRIFLVALLHWSPRHVYPLGAVIKVFPFGETVERGLAVLNLQNKIPGLYKKETVERVESICRRVVDEPDSSELKGRKDLTSLNTFTIDPKGCRDIDDALSVEKVDSVYKVGVHIADVTARFLKDDPVDIEARERATTYYPGISKPRHMLPEPLSSKLCSLQENKKRLTISIIFFLDSEGRIVQSIGQTYELCKSYIVSKKQFTYEQVQEIIDRTSSENEMERDILKLAELSKKIRRRRLGNAMFAVDVDEMDQFDESEAKCDEAHYLVEEFMIMANTKVARLLKLKFPECVPLRCQQPPSQENMEDFFKHHGPLIDIIVSLQDKTLFGGSLTSVDNILSEHFKSEQNVVYLTRDKWKIIAGNDINKSSRCIRSDDLHPLQHVIRQQWLSIQTPALYKCSSCRNDQNSDDRHFSLAIEGYTHFTSPIRRFIDVVIHRLIHALIEGKPCPYKRSDVETICHHVSSRMKRAKAYEKGCNALMQAIEFQKNQRAVSAFIDDISDRGLILSSKEIRNVAKQHRELQFNLLNVSTKPNVDQDVMTNKKHVTVTWNRRLYDINRSTDNPDNGIVHELNPRRGIVSLPLTQWARLLRCALSERDIDLQRAIQQTRISTGGSGREDISTECNDPWQISSSTKFSLKSECGNAVIVQMSATAVKGILAPKPVLLNLTENVKFCLNHTDDPVRYLCIYSTNPTCVKYNSLRQYVQRWTPLISMQAAVAAVRNEECFVINNVPVTFTGPQKGKFALFNSYCAIRNLDFSGTQKVDDDEGEDDDTPLSYDWLCIKQIVTDNGSTKNPKAVAQLKSNIVNVFHAYVTKVKKKKSKTDGKDGKTVVMFELHKDSNSIPEEARTGEKLGHTFRYSVEVLKKTETDRRTESILRNLEASATDLAKAIALNNGPFPVISHKNNILRAKEIDIILRSKIERSTTNLLLPFNNKEQGKAIDMAAKSRFTLIQGPPGTGKTYTGIKLIFLFCQMNKESCRHGTGKKTVLFCGPSNKSVDLVAKLMIGRLGNLCPKFVRAYGRSIEALDFPVPGRTFTYKKTKELKVEAILKNVALHHVIRQKGKPHAERLTAFDRIFKEKNYQLDSEEMFKKVNEYLNLLREAEIAEVKENEVILCTTAVASNPKVIEGASVEQIIIDEAGMCMEPECLVPIVATKAAQVVLIGDHKQLRPIVTCTQAAELGLDKSLFERYANLTSSGDCKNVEFTSLKVQYRMHPGICEFPSRTFYGDNLITGRLSWNAVSKQDDVLIEIWPFDSWGMYPHVLVHVEGEEQILTVSTDEGNEMSRSNAAEVEQVVKIYRYMIENGVDASKIRIMSQYNAQCAEIRKALENAAFTNFVVATVVSSQGEEADYVIFSTVRSLPDYKIEDDPTLGWCKSNLGFITDCNQVNVALTRARKGLVIVGNTKLLRCDRVWKKLISHYEQRKCLKTTEEFPPPRKSRQQIMEENRLRNEIRYRDTMFLKGEATSFEGDYDAVESTSGHFRGRGRRGGRRGKMRFGVGQPLENNVAFDSDSD